MANLTKLFAIALLAVSFPVIALSGPAPSETPQRTWIIDVTIISPENLEHIEKGSVLIENGRIVRVDRKARPKKPADAQVVSGKGLFLIPGLIDSHVHLAIVPGMDFDQMGSKQQLVREYYRQLPRSYLYYGYTTLIDLAVFDRQVLQDFRKAPDHPDLYDCGESLPFANGYPMSFLPSPLRFQIFPNIIYDPAQADSIPVQYKPEDHTPASAVAAVKRSGGVCVKIYFERGFGRNHNLPVMGPDVLAEVRRAATENGLVLMMHANAFEAQKFGVGGNVDVLAHGMWNWGKLSKSEDMPSEIKQVLDEVVQKKIGYQATIRVLYGETAYFDPDYLQMPAIPKVVPKALLDWFNTPEGKAFKKNVDNEGAPDATVRAEYEQGPIRHVRLAAGYLASKDANFLFGTDTPSAPTYGNLPGLNGYLEMQELKKAGLSLKQIFLAATLHNAREFKLDSDLGTIERGKIANVVLLQKSPLESLDAYDSIVTVWVHGKAIPRADLAAPQTK
jgi:hypothetical protein